ncbi:MAG: helix-turn-helix domain-containing protein [Alphaproteobacteria bacterium]
MTDEQTEHPKKKKSRSGGKPQGGPAQHAAPGAAEESDAPVHTVGKTLCAAREKMGLTLEDVSASINVRVVQLQAIEDDRIDQLPGMTYAVGFVRSYAQFLKLDAKEIVATFKREHEGEPAAKTALHFSDPISEDKLPGPVLIGAAAFGIVVLFVAWSLLASDDDGVQLAENIPPAPVVGTASGQPTLADAQPLTGYTTGMITPAEPAAETAAAAAAGTVETPDVTAAPAPAVPAAQAPPETEMVVRPTRASEERPVPPPQVINVKRGKTRVLIEANQKSWVQISDGSGKVIYKKVMAQGEQFFVPDQPGMTLVTSNAGGLNIIVDGVQAQSLGRSGEILRGVALNPDELKKRRIRVRN